MAEEINKMLDELTEDFKYTMDFALNLLETLPGYFWWDQKKKVEHIRDIQEKYFEGV